LVARLKTLGGRMPGPPHPTGTQTPPDVPHVAECPQAPDSTLTGAIISNVFDGETHFGVVEHDPTEEPPFVFKVSYTDGDMETMSRQEVAMHQVHSWTAVPMRTREGLRNMGGRMPATTHPTPPARASDNTNTPHGSHGSPPPPARSTRPSNSGQTPSDKHPSTRPTRAASARQRAAAQWCHGGIRVGTINAHGLTAVQTMELGDIMLQNDIDILGVTETWEGRCRGGQIAGYTYISKARPGGQGGGVGFYISRALLPLVTPVMDTALPESIWLKVRNTRPRFPPLCLGLVYLPPSQLETAQGRQHTFAALQQDVNTFRQHGEVCLMGDFNCRVGRAITDTDHIGPWGEPIDRIDARGQALRTFLRDNDLYTLNGRSPTPLGEPEHTWAIIRTHNQAGSDSQTATHADDGTPIATPSTQPAPTNGETPAATQHSPSTSEQRSIIDYILTPAHMALVTGRADAPSSCLRVEPQWRVSGTDHMLLWCNLPHSKPQQADSPDQQRAPTARTYKLTSPSPDRDQYRAEYRAAVTERADAVASHIAAARQAVQAGTMTAAQATAASKEQVLACIHDAVEATIGFAPPPNPARKPSLPLTWTAQLEAAKRAKQQAAHALARARTTLSRDDRRMATARQDLKAAHSTFKRAVAKARAERKDTLTQAARRYAQAHDSKRCWAVLNRLAGKRQTDNALPTAVKAADGTLKVAPADIANTMKEHYKQVQTADAFAQGAGFDDVHKASIEATVTQHRTHTSHADQGSSPYLCEDITAEEVAAVATMALHNHRAPSPLDGVSNELLKYGGDSMHSMLATYYALQWELEHKAQTPGVVRSLHKRGDPTLPTNYRPITLGATIDKLYNLILNRRLQEHLERTNGLHEAQNGFRAGRSGVDNILMLNQVLQSRMRQHKTTYLLFLDIEKAYDSVWRAGLLYHLWEKGVRGKMFRVLAQMCDNPTSMVWHGGCLSDPFQPEMGWEQGDTLATTMFNIYINTVLEAAWQQPGVPLDDAPACATWRKIAALMYADDMVALASDRAEMQNMVTAVSTEMRKWRIKASVSSTDTSKTAVMEVRATRRYRAQPSTPADPIMWGPTTLPQVQSYRYLGVTITDNGCFDDHVANKLEKGTAAARAMHGVLHNSKLPLSLRKLGLMASVLPVVHYAAEVWHKNTATHRKKLDSWYMQVVTAMMHCPTATAHACLQQELGILPLSTMCDMRVLHMWHRVRTCSPSRLLGCIARAWGNTSTPWSHLTNTLLTTYGIDEQTALVSPRKRFAGMVRAGVHRRTQELRRLRAQLGGVHGRYHQQYTPSTPTDVEAPQPYHTLLGQRGYAAELLMKLRLECLPLRVWANRDAAPAARERAHACPCCQAQPPSAPPSSNPRETLHHFLLDCNQYHEARQVMLAGLQTAAPQAYTHFTGLPPSAKCHMLLRPDLWGSGGGEEQQGGGQQHQQQPQPQQHAPMPAPVATTREQAAAVAHIATFITTAWQRRNTALSGRETNGTHPMV